jgi:hypothetical protein
MKTQVIMKRKLFDSEIEQQSKTGFLSANNLILAGNKWRILNNLPAIRLQDWLSRDSTKEFINELETQLNISVKIASRGRNASTWLHPYLFIDLALTISPKLKIEVYSWLYDELLRYRNDSGDSYKLMAGSLWKTAKNKTTFYKSMSTVALMIQKACNVTDWQKATEQQLRLRDKIHNNISLLADILRDNNQAVRLGIMKSIENN